MSETDWPADDLRARLAAEATLAHKKTELEEANSKIAAHAKQLTDQIIETRQENIQVKTSLEAAQSAVRIAERRLWESLETIEDGFAVFDSDDRLIAANRAYLAPFEDLEDARVGTSYGELLKLAVEEGIVDHGDMRAADWVEMMLSRWRAPGTTPLTVRLWNDVSVRLIEQRTQDGDTVILAVDVTDAIAREKELHEARNKAESANRAKSAFLANMSHEIRTPMNGVLAMADILAEGSLSEEQRLCLDTIRKSGEALLVIINDVLDYSRIEAEKLSLHTAPFDLEQLVNDVIVLLQPSAREKGLEMIVDYDMFLPTQFVGDTGRIRQILTNLVGNAVKFTSRGHVLVRIVGLPGSNGQSHRIHVAVEDTGIGISHDMQEHIFGEFNQAEDEMNRAFDGTGLGLAITKRLVNLMGGDVWVNSEPGQGATFGFQIDLPQVMSDDETGPTPPEWLGRVAIVDCNPISRQILQKQLSAVGIVPECLESIPKPDTDSWTTRDVVFVAQSSAETGSDPVGVPANTFLVCQGPAIPGRDLPQNAHVMFRPFLRRELLERLANLPTPLDETPPAPELPTPEEPRRMRVLAAEDNKTNQLVLKTLLKAVDIDLTIVENGQEAVDAYRAAPPDLFLTDISMPIMDGKEATSAIRRFESENNLPRCPIIAMTAHATLESEDATIAAGVDHYLTKPLKREILVTHIENAAPENATPLMAAE